MRSMPVSMTIVGFCITAPILGCFWTWFVTLRLSALAIGFWGWIVLNSIAYLGIAFFYHKLTGRINHPKWSIIIRNGLRVVEVGLLIAIAFSTYRAYEISEWISRDRNLELHGLGGSLELLIIGVINGVLIGLATLTIGYRWLPQNERKPKA